MPKDVCTLRALNTQIIADRKVIDELKADIARLEVRVRSLEELCLKLVNTLVDEA